MPNTFAYVALMAWPLLATGLFLCRRISPLTATFCVIVGGYLFLPVKTEIDLPLLPPLDRQSLPAICCLACCLLIRRMRVSLIPNGGFVRWFFLVLLIAPFLSVITNPEPVFDGAEYKRGLVPYDAISDVIRMYLDLLPLLLGLTLVRRPEDLAQLMKLLIAAAIIYSPLILLEIRISPQLHTWVYGFFPHQFIQQVRFDGYRPVVFIGHGLLVAIFVAIATCAAAMLWRQRFRLAQIPTGFLLCYLMVVLALCKSVGAWLLGMTGLIGITCVPAKALAWTAVTIALLVVAYPLIAISGQFPDEQLIDLAAMFGDDRAQSIAFRFYHEERLLEHAGRKLEFGWGGWGRNRLHDSVTDGHWVNVIGSYGLLGFFAKAGLFLLAIVGGARALRYLPGRADRGLLAGNLLVLSLVMVDQIPNSSVTSYTLLMLGAVLGLQRQLRRSASRHRAPTQRSLRSITPAAASRVLLTGCVVLLVGFSVPSTPVAAMSRYQADEVIEEFWYRDPLEGKGYPQALDVFELNHRPAGRHGFLRAQGDTLVFADGTLARFWGANIQARALFDSDKASVQRHARRLARLGFNLVRIHHHDSPWVSPNIFDRTGDDTLRLNADSLARLDWWIHCLRQQGIYIWLDLHVERAITAADNIQHFADLAGEKEAASLKGFNYVNAEIKAAMQAFNRAYLNHHNPYTGLRYRDDPAIVAGLITNENDLTHHYGHRLLKKHAPWHRAQFTQAAANMASTMQIERDSLLDLWEPGPPAIFLNRLENNFNEDMLQHLRELGFRAPLATTSSWGSMGLSSLPALAAGNFIDAHGYARGDQFSLDPRSQTGLFHRLAAAQVSDKPFTVSEWNMQEFPATARYQLPLYLASLGAFQGWDALVLYGYAQRPLNYQGPGDNWSSFRDPVLMALMPAAALLYRDHIAPARRHYRLRLPPATYFDKHIDADAAVAIRTLAEQSRITIDLPYTETYPWLTEHPKTGKVTQLVRDHRRSFLGQDRVSVQSDTGQISRDWRHALFTIISPRSVVVAGALSANSPITLGPVELHLETAEGAIAVQSLDGREITHSETLLVTAIGEARREPDGYQLESIQGHLRIEMSESETELRANRGHSNEALPGVACDGNFCTLKLDDSIQSPWVLLRRPTDIGSDNLTAQRRGA